MRAARLILCPEQKIWSRQHFALPTSPDKDVDPGALPFPIKRPACGACNNNQYIPAHPAHESHHGVFLTRSRHSLQIVRGCLQPPVAARIALLSKLGGRPVISPSCSHDGVFRLTLCINRLLSTRIQQRLDGCVS